MFKVTVLNKDTTEAAFVGYTLALLNVGKLGLYPMNTWDKGIQAALFILCIPYLVSVGYAIILHAVDIPIAIYKRRAAYKAGDRPPKVKTGCQHTNTRIWEPHLAGARKCNDCGLVKNPNYGPHFFIEE